MGNSLFGAVFGLFIGRYLGSGLGWLLILLGGATGNALNAVMRPDDFSSIGASTATFAALALGCGFVWRKGYFRGRGWRRAFAPIFAGLAMLSFTGMGGERTDVLAHVTGFFAGLGLGLLAASWDLDRLGPRGQRLPAADLPCRSIRSIRRGERSGRLGDPEVGASMRLTPRARLRAYIWVAV